MHTSPLGVYVDISPPQSDICGRKTFVPLILGLSHPFTIDTRVPKPLYSVELRLFHDLEQSFPLYNFYNVMPEITSNIYCKQVCYMYILLKTRKNIAKYSNNCRKTCKFKIVSSYFIMITLKIVASLSVYSNSLH